MLAIIAFFDSISTYLGWNVLRSTPIFFLSKSKICPAVAITLNLSLELISLMIFSNVLILFGLSTIIKYFMN